MRPSTTSLLGFVLWAPNEPCGDGIVFLSLEMIQCLSWFDWSQSSHFTKMYDAFLALLFLQIRVPFHSLLKAKIGNHKRCFGHLTSC